MHTPPNLLNGAGPSSRATVSEANKGTKTMSNKASKKRRAEERRLAEAAKHTSLGKALAVEAISEVSAPLTVIATPPRAAASDVPATIHAPLATFPAAPESIGPEVPVEAKATEPTSLTGGEAPPVSVASAGSTSEGSVTSKPRAVSFGTWLEVANFVAGPKHYRTARPGQDYAVATLDPRPVAVACDGKGSGKLSEHGSRAICEKTLELVDTLDYLFQDMLDCEPHDPAFSKRTLLHAFTRSWARTIAQLALHLHAKPSDLETTLNAVIAGKLHTLLLQVGDGAVVGIRHSRDPLAERLIKPTRGEYAGETCFIGARPLSPRELVFNIVPTAEWRGFACMSDGASDLLVQPGTGRADGLAQLAIRLEGQRRNEELAEILTDPRTWPAHLQDDRSIAIIWDSCRPV